MDVEKTTIKDVLIITPEVFGDDRGFFKETFHKIRYENLLGQEHFFVQDNVSLSQKGVLRGLHYQKPPTAQGKLIQVLRGKVFDVAVDIRHNSETFGQYVGVELSADNHHQLWIPPGFAHGFLTLQDDTLFAYKCTDYYSPQDDAGIIWNDPDIAIAWPDLDMEYIISDKDQKQSLLKNAPKDFEMKNFS